MTVHVGPRGVGHISRAGGFEPDALLALDFLAGRYRVGTGAGATDDFADLPGLSVVRSTTGYAERSDGVLVPFAANVARITDKGLLVEEGRTNSQLRSTTAGASAGSPGTGPTGWTISLGLVNGVARSIAATGTDVATGLAYFELNLVGTFTASENLTIAPMDINATAAAPGQAWTGSMYWAVAAGVLPAPSTPSINGVRVRYGNPTLLVQTGSSDTPNASMAARQVSANRIAPAGTTGVGADWLWSFGAGQAIDVRIRLAGPQLEQGAFVTSFIPTAGVPVIRDPDTIGFAAGALLTPSFTAMVTYSIPNLDGVELRPLTVGDGTGLNRIELQRTAGGNAASGFMIAGGVNQAGPTLAASGKTGARRIRQAMRVRPTTWNMAADGVTGTESATVSLPDTSQLLLYSPSLVRLNGWIEEVLLLGDTTNTQLQSLTQ